MRIAVLLVLAAACERKAPRSESLPPRVLDSAPGAAAPAATACTLARATWRWPAQPRVIAFGDVHGDREAMLKALRLAGVIDAQATWSGGKTWVVQTGDLLDRGDDEQQILDDLERLEREAEAAGGRLVWLNGNHELMNTAGDLRYVTPGGFRDFEDVAGLDRSAFARAPEAARARLAAFAPGGPYARVLAGQNLVAVVGDTAFVHGGIVPGKAAGLDDANHAARCWLDGQGPMPAVLEDDAGPLWDRSQALDPVDCAAVDRALAELGVARIVVGHTVQEHGITPACDGKVWRIDVGLAAYYGGPSEVLELTTAGPKILGR
jgi:hypothetical protein